MKALGKGHARRTARWSGVIAGMIALTASCAELHAFTLIVTDPTGGNPGGFRWLVEEDNTDQPVPGVPVSVSASVLIHKSHAPVVASGHSPGGFALINLPSDTRYFVSVLPDAGHTMGGASVAVGQDTVSVVVNPHPVPTAQISILVFHDVQPLNNSPEIPVEAGLEGFTVLLHDTAGQMLVDVFGNPLGTQYQFDAAGDPLLDTNGTPIVATLGDGVITTDEFGEALVKFIAPGKYGVQIVPPPGQGWIQTTTIEGTPTIDAWVKADEPPVFVEFGPAAYHIFVGFVQQFDNLSLLMNSNGSPTGSITGRLVYNHFAPPPNLQGFFAGPPVQDAWVGLNDPLTFTAVYAAPADNAATGEFTISGIPEGTYQLVSWDKHLDSIFGFNTIVMPDPTKPDPWNYELGDGGDVLVFRWFGTYQGSVFFDADTDGFRDPGEAGVPLQDVIVRFRDGTIYQVQPTDILGNFALTEIFPFFKWLVLEIDFLRFKDTGFTNIVDAGGQIPPDDGWNMPSRGVLNPQPQVDSNGVPIVNPNTGNNLSRTESGGAPGEFLLQAAQLYLGQTNIVDWGKMLYGPNENGGIAGIVYYAVTRAENDPAYAAAEEWEPGIPRVQVNLYEDWDGDGIIDDLNADGFETLADVDNHPLGWFDDPLNPAAKGLEDVDWNGNGAFDPGDAVQIVHTDSWDDNTPTGCMQTLPIVHGQEVPECFDNFGTWNQIRPGVFDGGFAISSYFPGGMESGSAEATGPPPGFYIVEAVPPPGYETVKEEDKNVDFGDEYVPGTRALPPPCVGDDHAVPPFLTLVGDVNGDGICDPGAECVDAPFAGDVRPLCDRKLVTHSDGQNTAVEFFMFTAVPKAARGVGFINNDLAAEFDPTSPVFGEKQAPSWLPIAFMDYRGNEITRVYCDEFGTYNVMLPSTYSVNIPSPTGVSPHMVSFVLNHPGPIPDPNNPGQFTIDPYFDPNYSQTPYTFNFESGRTTYLDTPVIPVAAFAGSPNRALDIEAPDGTPGIYSVLGPTGGPTVCAGNGSITITSLGDTDVPNPDDDPASPVVITRDYGFGIVPGMVTVEGVPLGITSWDNDTIVATVDTALVSTGRLVVTRGDNGLSSQLGVTLHVGNGDCRPIVIAPPPSAWPDTPLQDTIDAAAPGTLIVLEPGTYKENLIIWKNVQLQGSAPGSTYLNGSPIPFERVTAWHDKIDALIATGDLEPVDEEEAERFFEATEAPCILVLGKAATFDQNSPGLIDGMTIMGGISGGGLYINGFADYMSVSNNKIMNNQGTIGGGITVGQPGFDTFNNNITIHHNTIAKNGAINGGGGVTIFGGADNYALLDNTIIGNFSRNVGAGIAQLDVNTGGIIARNRILFNELFYGAAVGGNGAGIYLTGRPGAGPAAVGPTTVEGNLIQGNLAGSGNGGGIAVINLDGGPQGLSFFNNMIVNNVAAYRGGGFSLSNAANVNIIHNTIAHNDSTSTAAFAFPPGIPTLSTPHVAGIAAADSDPLLVNNIIWRNRSYFWDMNAGGLQPRTPLYWDLDEDAIGPLLNPRYCILSDTTGYDPTNISADPKFLKQYHNVLLSAFAFDEGGNFISVRYRELSASDGDYHLDPSPNARRSIPLRAFSSPAKDAGTDGFADLFPELAADFDGDARPQFDGNDIGADEIIPVVTIVPIVLQVPSGLEVTGTLPDSASVLDLCASAFIIEMWAQQTDPNVTIMPRQEIVPVGAGTAGPISRLAKMVAIGSREDSGQAFAGVVEAPAPDRATESGDADLRTGLSCVFADLAYDNVNMTCDGTTPAANFATLATGACVNPSGLVNELGGCAFPTDLGVAPLWVKIATVDMSARDGFLTTGNVIDALAADTAVSIAGVGNVPVDRIWFASAPPFDVESCLYDLDGDCFAGPGDFAAGIQPCWLSCQGEGIWDTFGCDSVDYDCSGCIDPGDFAFFVTAWLRNCGDPDTVVHPCLGGLAPLTGGRVEDLAPASREIVESFGLRYPKASERRFKRLSDSREMRPTKRRARRLSGRPARR